ncbi:tyrosine-type recombinase/integrase [Pelagibius sp.]|uniref:tyrosine-type recombinase/integrase n=1 Tax=Pelagibius sp. TaxID=1931238 RepID=UPI003BB19B8A
MAKLTARRVQTLKEPGRYSDGGGLMLLIDKHGAKRWILRVQFKGRRRDIGLGSLSDVSLADARDQRDEMRKKIRAGVDPVAERRRERQRVRTFEEAARAVHKEFKENPRKWQNKKHAKQWITTLETYVFPRLGSLSVDEIDAALISAALKNIWFVKPETARRTLQRICIVLDIAHVRRWRRTDVPNSRSIARDLGEHPKEEEKHLPALDWEKVPAFVSGMKETLKSGEPVLLLMEFTILTAARSGESRGAKWCEVDFDGRVWNISAERMKAKRAHRVPLCDRAIEILKRMQELRRRLDDDALIFEGRPGRPFSDMTLTQPLRRAGLDITMHGFRSSFRDWVAEATGFQREVAEKALAHKLGNKTEAAYQRGDLFEKRRKLMDAWASYIAGDKGNVVSMSKRHRSA